ncbi:hypothetical protein K466DRAFT_369564 [Polyporus arcularius HHB13444]|uniref:Uncharacterized protein n=1 Tax=Polyporus arcularius HHB13444 TaxID=1314778 RepID=A0A5C3PLW9_9APHY|nr:hypothetical protein K466DRAFT_369564 [Polyporus arcularius HHB13444]
MVAISNPGSRGGGAGRTGRLESPRSSRAYNERETWGPGTWEAKPCLRARTSSPRVPCSETETCLAPRHGELLGRRPPGRCWVLGIAAAPSGAGAVRVGIHDWSSVPRWPDVRDVEARHVDERTKMSFRWE